MKSKDKLLRLISAFKLAKAVSLILVGAASLRAADFGAATELAHWIAKLGFDPGNRLVERALVKASALSPDKIKELGLVSFIYAMLFLIEGIGLWLGKRWAEWFTVIITGSLIPFEIYELFRHPNVPKVFALLVNVAVVWYLIARIRNKQIEQA
jgi:uncharacterized membrane protein (DUF2068 family)